jgi:hypothetical protein
MNPIPFLMRRLEERSTLMAIGAGVTVASALPCPWSWISLGIAALAAIVPDGSIRPGA